MSAIIGVIATPSFHRYVTTSDKKKKKKCRLINLGANDLNCN